MEGDKMTNQRKKRSDATHNKAIILQTTTQLLAQGEDISEMNMSEIAKKAGVGVGTLYRHFESKSLLCQAMMDEKVHDMFDEMDTFLHQHQDASVRDKIYGILSIYLDLKEANFNVLNFIDKSNSQHQSMINIPFYEQLKELIKDQFTSQQQTQDLEFKINLMLNSFSSDFYYFAKHDQQLTKDQFLSRLLDIFIG
ncbi:TetR/AcrR family transcriptional regulator [Staphylococcus warneri]|nr:TetR/AcrR family transcriptional regulator [Staphylococcus warneri]